MHKKNGVYTPPLINLNHPLAIHLSVDNNKNKKKSNEEIVECSICCYPIEYIARVNCTIDHPICAI